MAKILFVSDDPSGSTGYATAGRELIRGMVMAGHTVEVIGWSYSGKPHGLPYVIHQTPQNDYWGTSIISNIINLADPPFTQIYFLGDPWMLEPFFQLPVVRDVYTVGYFPIDGQPIPPQWRKLFERMDRIIVISKYAQEAVKKMLPNRRVDLLYHGVDINLFKPLPPEEKSKRREQSGFKDKFVCLCCDPDTDILMNDLSNKKIVDIKSGDLVFTHKGRIRPVTEIFKREHSGDIYNIKTYGNYKELKITPEHPVYAIKKRGRHDRKWNPTEPDFYEIKDLQKGDYIGIPIPQIEVKNKEYIDVLEYVTQFKNIEETDGRIKNGEWRSIPRYIPIDEDFMRFCGLFLAEGSYFYRDKEYPNGISFCLNNNKEDSREFLYNYAERLGLSVMTWKDRDRNDSNYAISHKLFSCLIKELLGEHSGKKRIHNDLLQLKPELQFKLLLGFAEGDGCEDTDKRYGTKRNIMVTTSPFLAEQLYNILLINNIMTSISIQKKEKEHHALRYRIIWFYSQNSTVRFIKDNYIFAKIKNIIINKYNGNVYNFEVEEDNSYIANKLAVHNCVARKLVAA